MKMDPQTQETLSQGEVMKYYRAGYELRLEGGHIQSTYY